MIGSSFGGALYTFMRATQDGLQMPPMDQNAVQC